MAELTSGTNQDLILRFFRETLARSEAFSTEPRKLLRELQAQLDLVSNKPMANEIAEMIASLSIDDAGEGPAERVLLAPDFTRKRRREFSDDEGPHEIRKKK
jgi:hypothetical protein